MKQLYLFVFLFISFFSFAQTSPSREECYFDELFDKEKKTNTDLEQQFQLQETQLQKKIKEIQARQSSITGKKSASVYQIPVVVHIIDPGNNDKITSITDDVVKHNIEKMNRIFRAQNGGVKFDDRYGNDTQIEFVLAVRDENGNCTTGIDRIDYSGNAEYVQYGVVKPDPNHGVTDASIIAATEWDNLTYYNIYIVNKFYNDNTTIGYAYYPGNRNKDATFVLPAAFLVESSTILPHELGHAMNLWHTFEGSNFTDCPSIESTAGDFCADTPPYVDTSDQKNCSTFSENINTCANGYAPYGVELNKNKYFIYNMMSYSNEECRTMFTDDQTLRMTATLEGFRSGLLAQNGNQNLIPVVAPTVDFGADKTVTCGGAEISFSDYSTCIPNGYVDYSAYNGVSVLWTFTNGTTTLNSTLRNPKISFTEGGSYDVTLAVTVTGIGTTTKIKEKYITIGATGTPSTCAFGVFEKRNLSYTVSRVELNTIDNITSKTSNDIIDFRCEAMTALTEGKTYELAITANCGSGRTNYVKVWIDFNNDGAFDKNERVLADKVVSDGTVVTGRLTINLTIPESNVSIVKNKTLLMRVIGQGINATIDVDSDAATSNSGCFEDDQPSARYDIEDYGVIILNDPALGVDDFVNDSSWVVFRNGSESHVKTKGFSMRNIKVFDISGKMIFDSKLINSSDYQVPTSKTKQVLIYKITTDSGALLTKKVIN